MKTVILPRQAQGEHRENSSERPSLYAMILSCTQRDNTVPPGGGASSDGWFWVSVADYTTTWGDYNGCSGGSRYDYASFFCAISFYK